MGFWSVLAAAAAGVVAASAWYMGLSRRWVAATGRSEADLTAAHRRNLPFVLAFIGYCLTAGLLRHVLVGSGVTGFWAGLVGHDHARMKRQQQELGVETVASRDRSLDAVLSSACRADAVARDELVAAQHAIPERLGCVVVGGYPRFRPGTRFLLEEPNRRELDGLRYGSRMQPGLPQRESSALSSGDRPKRLSRPNIG